MPLGKDVRYRYAPGGKVRLAFRGGSAARKTGTVVEAKNVKTGATHTPAEFARDRKRSASSKRAVSGRRR